MQGKIRKKGEGNKERKKKKRKRLQVEVNKIFLSSIKLIRLHFFPFEFLLFLSLFFQFLSSFFQFLSPVQILRLMHGLVSRNCFQLMFYWKSFLFFLPIEWKERKFHLKKIFYSSISNQNSFLYFLFFRPFFFPFSLPLSFPLFFFLFSFLFSYFFS